MKTCACAMGSRRMAPLQEGLLLVVLRKSFGDVAVEYEAEVKTEEEDWPTTLGV